MDIAFKIDQTEYQISSQKKDNVYHITIDKQQIEVKATAVTQNCLLLEESGGRHRIYIAEGKEKTFAFLNGRQVVLEHVDESSGAASHLRDDVGDAGAEICAPMPGKVLKILVQLNQEVQPKQSLVIVEAMKMEHNITTPKKAVVKKINFKEGALVEAGQQILELEISEEKS